MKYKIYGLKLPENPLILMPLHKNKRVGIRGFLYLTPSFITGKNNWEYHL